MGILDKIKDEAEKLMQRKPGENAERAGGHRGEETPADDMQTAQNTIRPQGGAPEPDMDQGTGMSQDTVPEQHTD